MRRLTVEGLDGHGAVRIAVGAQGHEDTAVVALGVVTPFVVSGAWVAQ